MPNAKAQTPLSDRVEEFLDLLKQAFADIPEATKASLTKKQRLALPKVRTKHFRLVDTAFPDIKPIVMAAVAIFRKYQKVADDLTKAKASLLERETINRAKSLLMRQRHIDEPQAYRWLRRRAMNESRRIGEVAAELLASEGSAPK